VVVDEGLIPIHSMETELIPTVAVSSEERVGLARKLRDQVVLQARRGVGFLSTSCVQTAA
jgi:hypothetical protein